MRVAVHPGDVTKQSLLTSIDRTLRTFAERRTVSRYADLASDVATERAPERTAEQVAA